MLYLTQGDLPNTQGDDALPNTQGEDALPNTQGEDALPNTQGDDALTNTQGDDALPNCTPLVNYSWIHTVGRHRHYWHKSACIIV